MCLRRPGTTTYLRRRFDTAALRRCLEAPEAALDHSVITKSSRSTRAGIATLDGNAKIFIKKYNTKSLRYLARYFFRQARPFRVWQASWLLENAGVRTPAAIAAVATRSMRLLVSAYLLTEAVEGAVPDDTFFKAMLLDDRRLGAFCGEIVSILARVHAAGVEHGDCKLSNFFFPEWRSGAVALGVWDLDGARCVGEVSADGRARDLARSIASVSEKVRLCGGGDALRELAALYSQEYERQAKTLIPAARLEAAARPRSSR